jgi:hypothetical protein
MRAKANDCPKSAKASSWPELEHRLRSIFEIEPSDGSVILLQSKYALALAEIARFMTDERSQSHMGELAAAMHDLAEGIQPKILRAKPRTKSKGGRSIDQSDVWSARVTAVLGLECLIAADEHKKKADERAADRAAKDFPELERLRREKRADLDKGDLCSSMLSWRKHLKDKTCLSKFAQNTYDDEFRNLAWMLPRTAPSERIKAGYEILSKAEKAAKSIARTK